jgi:hypothetical protein
VKAHRIAARLRYSSIRSIGSGSIYQSNDITR